MDDLAKLYQIRFSDAEREKKDLVWKVLCEDYFQQFISPSSIVLDIASGYGEFIRHISASRKIAVDLNPDSQSYLPDSIEFHLGSASDLTMRLVLTLSMHWRMRRDRMKITSTGLPSPSVWPS